MTRKDQNIEKFLELCLETSSKAQQSGQKVDFLEDQVTVEKDRNAVAVRGNVAWAVSWGVQPGLKL